MILSKVAKLLAENQGDDDDLRSVTRDHHKNACMKPVFYLFKNYDFPYLFFITTFRVCVYVCLCITLWLFFFLAVLFFFSNHYVLRRVAAANLLLLLRNAWTIDLAFFI